MLRDDDVCLFCCVVMNSEYVPGQFLDNDDVGKDDDSDGNDDDSDGDDDANMICAIGYAVGDADICL